MFQWLLLMTELQPDIFKFQMKTQLNINVDVARVSKFKHWPHY